MRRLLGVVVLVFLVAGGGGCSGGGGGDAPDYDFNGTWSLWATLVQSNPPGAPEILADVLQVTQSGPALTVKIDSIATPLTGVCDPEAGTYQVGGIEQGVAMTLSALGVDEDSMSGEFVLALGPAFARYSVTIELLGRGRRAEGIAGQSRGLDVASGIAALR